MKDTEKSATSAKTYGGFTDEERAAMKERAQELKAESRRGSRGGKADGESDVLEKIAEMPEADRAMAQRIHAKASAPELVRKPGTGCLPTPKTARLSAIS